MHAVDQTAPPYSYAPSAEGPIYIEQDPFHEAEAQAPPPRRKIPFNRSYILFMILLMTASAGSAYLYNLMDGPQRGQVLLSLDPLGLTPAGKAEKARVYDIRMLNISSEKKDVLIARTIFIGCTEEMARLALGKPREVQHHPAPAVNAETWTYYLAEEKRPTLLEFHDGTLVAAYKGSALDVIHSREGE